MSRNPRVAQLVISAQSGDKEAWTALVHEFQELVWRVANTYRFSEADALDVCQDTWLKAATKIDSLREPARFAGWITTIADREALMLIRRKNREQPHEDVQSYVMDAAGDEPDEPLLRRETIDQVREAFLQLSQKCRTLLTMLTADPRPSYETVSAQLGMAIGSIGSTRKRCLTSFSVLLSKESHG